MQALQTFEIRTVERALRKRIGCRGQGLLPYPARNCGARILPLRPRQGQAQRLGEFW
jgi:hypothetical protein